MKSCGNSSIGREVKLVREILKLENSSGLASKITGIAPTSTILHN